jgi:hypothetical protein
MSTATTATAAQIVGLSLQNAGSGALAAGVTDLAQVFQAGDLPAGTGLVARVGGVVVPVQLDVKTTHPDGSVKMALLSFERPMMAAGATVPVVLEKAPVPAGQGVVDLASVSAQHSFVVELMPAGQPKITVDVLAALRDALSKGTASLWQQGPLATEARVEIDLPGSMRLKFDVTAYRDGQISVDAIFANDQAMLATGGRVAYDVVARLDGREVIRESVDQFQYQTWLESASSGGANGGQGLGSPSAGWLNIRHDVAYLKDTGAIASYDLSIPVAPSLLESMGKAISAPGWSEPLATNGVEPYMPGVGGRADIGLTTQHNVVWLLTGDARAAAFALGQAETAGAVPWNFWDAANGTWLNTDTYPRLWTDERGGTGRPGDPLSGGLTQQVASRQDTGWAPDRAHQPDLSTVPYLLTGERWILDYVQVQAARTIMDTWPERRQDGTGLVVNNSDARTTAWNLRQVENAAWLSPDGSPEKAYFEKVVSINWNWLVSKLPEWTALQGEAHGWLLVSMSGPVPGIMAPWQQDYFAGVAIISAKRGNDQALTVLDWMSNFLLGRFNAEDQGFLLRDGVTYNIAVADPTTGVLFKTWEEIGAATIARGMSNLRYSEWGGEYTMLGLATLAGLHELTGDTAYAETYRAILATKHWGTDEAAYSNLPGYGVTIPDIYDTFYPPKPAPAPSSPPTPIPTPSPGVPSGGTMDPNALPAPLPDQKPFTPKSVALGQGADTLVLRIAQDHWLGDAQYTVKVDGKQVGGVQTASALKSSGLADTVTLKGDWGALATVEVTFLNDAWGGTPSTDRNLFLLGATLNGKDVAGSSADLYSAGGFTFAASKPPVIQAPSDPNASSGAAVPQPPAIQAPADPNGLLGTAAADIIRSRPGSDVITGGAGADVFVFTRGSGADRITDFTPGTDRLLFEGIAPSSVKIVPTTVAGTAGLLVTYGTGDDSVFLANVAKLAAGDLVFG